jgi:phospholipase C
MARKRRRAGRTAAGRKAARRKAGGRKAAARALTARPADPFRHVVLLMLENRSFDHMLGALQQVIPGLDGVPTNGPPRSNPDIAGHPVEQRPVAAPVVDPDPRHEKDDVLEQLDDTNGRFVKNYERRNHGVTEAQKQAIMAYHSLGSLYALHPLGQAFVVGDAWHAAVPGPTWTNRLFAMSGTSLGRVEMPEGIFHPNLHRYAQPSIFRRLEEAGRSQRIYFGDFPLSLLLADRRRPLAALRLRDLERFFDDVTDDEADFPDFVFIEPRYMNDPNDDHPPHDVGRGQEFIARVYQAIRANRPLWESTLLVITYDEHGGFYDHVAAGPALPPDGNHQEYSFDRLGVRVPAVLVSPWLVPDVVHTECDHTALLRSLQVKWGLGDLGARVASAPDILTGLRRAPSVRDDTPVRLAPTAAAAPARAARAAAKRAALTAPLSGHQRAILAFSAYLETQTPAPAQQKVRASARAMKSPADARKVAEERARRYLAHLSQRARRSRSR